MSRRRRLFGVGFERLFDSASGVQAALVLDYAGVEGGRFWDGTNRNLSFSDIHTFTRASTATQKDITGLIVTSASGAHRLDHDKDGNRTGLVIEEARTNLVIQSNGFATTWTKSRAATPVGATTGPDGVSNSGWRHQDDGADNGAIGVFLRQVFTVSTEVTYTFSVFAKADQLSFLLIAAANFTTPPGGTNAWFNLGNGTVGTVAAGYDDSGIEDFGNGWYRCWVTFTTDATDTEGEMRVYVADGDNDAAVDTDGTSSIFIYGAQFEAGDSPSSYIPTTTVPVTRAAESAFVLTSAFGHNAVANTIYAQNVILGADGSLAFVIYMNNGSGNNEVHAVYRQSATEFRGKLNDGTTTLINLTSSGADDGLSHDLISGFSVGGYSGSADGATVVSGTTRTPTPTHFNIGGRQGSPDGWMNGHIGAAVYYAVNLSDADKEATTT